MRSDLYSGRKDPTFNWWNLIVSCRKFVFSQKNPRLWRVLYIHTVKTRIVIYNGSVKILFYLSGSVPTFCPPVFILIFYMYTVELPSFYILHCHKIVSWLEIIFFFNYACRIVGSGWRGKNVPDSLRWIDWSVCPRVSCRWRWWSGWWSWPCHKSSWRPRPPRPRSCRTWRSPLSTCSGSRSFISGKILFFSGKFIFLAANKFLAVITVVGGKYIFLAGNIFFGG